MSGDYLTRLIARTRQENGAVRPRLPSTFEPVSPGGPLVWPSPNAKVHAGVSRPAGVEPHDPPPHARGSESQRVGNPEPASAAAERTVMRPDGTVLHPERTVEFAKSSLAIPDQRGAPAPPTATVAGHLTAGERGEPPPAMITVDHRQSSTGRGGPGAAKGEPAAANGPAPTPADAQMRVIDAQEESAGTPSTSPPTASRLVPDGRDEVTPEPAFEPGFARPAALRRSVSPSADLSGPAVEPHQDDRTHPGRGHPAPLAEPAAADILAQAEGAPASLTASSSLRNRAAEAHAPTLPLRGPAVPALRTTGSQTRGHEAPGTQTGATPATVRVTIGRVEVRAVTEPAGPEPASTAPASPTLSLEDYLRGRSQGLP